MAEGFDQRWAKTVTEKPLIQVREPLLKRIFAFPNPVNNNAARFTAGLVVLLTLLTLITQWTPLYIILAIGFILRLAFGPRISPFALLAVKVLAPRVGEVKLTPGPPKRFAQGIGTLFSVGALIAHLAHAPIVATVLLVVLALAAFLEAALDLCLGCIMFGILQRRGIIPQSVCEACNNVTFSQAVRSSFSRQ